MNLRLVIHRSASVRAFVYNFARDRASVDDLVRPAQGDRAGRALPVMARRKAAPPAAEPD